MSCRFFYKQSKVQSFKPDVEDGEDSWNVMQGTYLGLTGFSTAQRSGLTLKPCSIRPMVKGNAPPITVQK